MLEQSGRDKLLGDLRLVTTRLQRGLGAKSATGDSKPQMYKLGLILAVLGITSAGCSDILGIEDITYQEPAPVDPCFDPEGFQGLGCFRSDGDCKLTKEQIPNACTDSPCMPFDNKIRLGLSAADDLPDVLDNTPIMFDSPDPSPFPACPSPSPTNPVVVVVGSNAIKPIVDYVSTELSRNENPVTVLFQGQSSCTGAAAILRNLAVKEEFTYWTYDMNGTPQENHCTLAEQQADIGVSDVFATTCGPDMASVNATETLGPIQAMIFAAPRASTEKSISAEAARLVYGYEGSFNNGQFTSPPWTKPAHIQSRNAASGTQNLIGKFIGVPSTTFKGHQNGSTGAMIASLTDPTLTDPNATIGLLDVVNGDKHSTEIRVLAFQAEGQHCAFQPNASEGSLDRRNVRDGHYVLWGPLHIFTGPNVSPEASTVVKYLSLEKAPPLSGQTEAQSMIALLGATVRGRLVPACAMRVQRSSEGGPLSTLIPQNTCGCRFEAEAGLDVSLACKPCTLETEEADCTSPDAPKCNFGYCEQQ
ncbi:MAG TPA: hypothetical protein PK156_27440 [Polyangium sp.]|nr:hypothetical protein [Polyangium sp.]